MDAFVDTLIQLLIDWGYAGLFISALLAGSIVPFSSEFVMARAMTCRTEEDIGRLFCIEASPYWRTHYVPAAAGDELPKRLGAFKARIIGINLVAVL